MAGATVSTIQLEIDVNTISVIIHRICLSAGFRIQFSLAASIPECP